MKEEDLDALLMASLADAPRAPDEAFVDHNRKRVALREMLARETRTALRRGVGDLVLAATLCGMLIAWSALIALTYDIAAIVLPLAVIAFWAIAHEWSFPDFSMGTDAEGDEEAKPVVASDDARIEG